MNQPAISHMSKVQAIVSLQSEVSKWSAFEWRNCQPKDAREYARGKVRNMIAAIRELRALLKLDWQ